jgi:hypothetical protein
VWFALVRNILVKYGIPVDDVYNFDETGFMMGIIFAGIVVTTSDLRFLYIIVGELSSSLLMRRIVLLRPDLRINVNDRKKKKHLERARILRISWM